MEPEKKKIEDHSHVCVDELCVRGIAALKKIKHCWSSKQLRCDVVKGYNGRNAFVYTICQLEDLAEEIRIYAFGD